MINILKNYSKKTIDIYDLAFEYRKKPVLQWSREEINEYIQQLQDLDDQRIIQIKRSGKGEANLDSIQRKITINKWNLEGCNWHYRPCCKPYYKCMDSQEKRA